MKFWRQDGTRKREVRSKCPYTEKEAMIQKQTEGRRHRLGPNYDLKLFMFNLLSQFRGCGKQQAGVRPKALPFSPSPPHTLSSSFSCPWAIHLPC